MIESEDYLGWDDENWVLIVFAVDRNNSIEGGIVGAAVGADDVRSYEMLPPPGFESNRTGILELDFYYADFPASLEQEIEKISGELVALGSGFFWFGFEGSFNFENLLPAMGVYAIRSVEGLSMALTRDSRVTPEWNERMLSAEVEVYAMLEQQMPGLSIARASGLLGSEGPTPECS